MVSWKVWKKRIKSLPWNKVVSDETLAKLTKAISTSIKFLEKVFAKLQKTAIYKRAALELSKVPKKYKILGIIVLIVILLFGGKYLLSARPEKVTVTGSKSVPVAKLVKGTPNYSTVLPQGKTIQSLGGWTRISPPRASPVYTYVDKINDVQIDVSEQPLPPNFTSNPAEQLSQLAQNENATEKITVNGTIVYVGTAASGSQSVFLIKSNVLVLIESNSTVSINDWVKYINSLQ
jgi:hypothetical protein